jgi:class 3 adenylate cyclase
VIAELPSGTVTFLFTDVEGSTRLLRGERVECTNSIGVLRRGAGVKGVETRIQG